MTQEAKRIAEFLREMRDGRASMSMAARAALELAARHIEQDDHLRFVDDEFWERNPGQSVGPREAS